MAVLFIFMVCANPPLSLHAPLLESSGVGVVPLVYASAKIVLKRNLGVPKHAANVHIAKCNNIEKVSFEALC